MLGQVGGRIHNYLLEKSRVVHQLTGERNFHIFFQVIFFGGLLLGLIAAQLLSGATDELLAHLGLSRDPAAYVFTSSGQSGSLNDKQGFLNLSTVRVVTRTRG